MSREPFLRYTNIASLMDTLLNQRIFLLDPSSWDDKNDSYYIDVYKEKEKLKTVLAICFAETFETFHHWKVFSDNISGVCIEFYKDKLLKHFEKDDNIIMKSVKYKTIPELQQILISGKLKNSDLPFYKRYPYRDEEEFRIIYKNAKEELPAKAFSINISCIKQILLSHHMPDALLDSINQIIQNIDGCSKVEVIKTSLIDNQKWKSIIQELNQTGSEARVP